MNCEEARAEAQAKKVRLRVRRKKQRRCRWLLGGHVYRFHLSFQDWECLCCGYCTSNSPMRWRVVEKE